MNLYEMATNYRDLTNRDDLNPDTIADTLDALTDSMNVKIDNIASWIDENQADIEFAKKRIKDLQAEKKRLDGLNDRLNGYLADTLDQAGIKKLTTGQHIVSVRNYRASTVVSEPDKLTADFVKEVHEYQPDKTAIYKALSAGKNVPGAHLEPNRKAVIK
ncbi:siphovirus Gp157 family protein [Lactiplantibacillus plantarum]|uniref:siphovirus Gp157 family protein n=1 Tax=Lactiplantibacillus plantarum TaxID=1590 RepID=UPI002348EF0F|nr:siphovirus Gp157 family protein [Lactiplantibacillus plantarum]WCL67896.1 siphovirus Gp157 family protein [Lactiplantibacillus plantarum]